MRLQTCLVHGKANGFAHAFQTLLLTLVGFRGQTDGTTRLALVVHNTRLHGGAADVEANE